MVSLGHNELRLLLQRPANFGQNQQLLTHIYEWYQSSNFTYSSKRIPAVAPMKIGVLGRLPEGICFWALSKHGRKESPAADGLFSKDANAGVTEIALNMYFVRL